MPPSETSEAQSTAPLADRELVARLRDGDEPAFRRLVADFGPAMLRVAGVYAPDTQVAEDIVQETWIAVLRGLDGFEGRSSFRTWVFTILGNCAQRRAKTESRSAPMSSIGPAGGEEIELDSFFTANHPRWASCWTTVNTRWDALPEDALTAREAERAMAKALEGLPPSQAAVITLRDLEGFTSEEVCSLLELSPGNQRLLLHRARLAIRRALRDVVD